VDITSESDGVTELEQQNDDNKEREKETSTADYEMERVKNPMKKSCTSFDENLESTPEFKTYNSKAKSLQSGGEGSAEQIPEEEFTVAARTRSKSQCSDSVLEALEVRIINP
jgi:hypothetical protein